MRLVWAVVAAAQMLSGVLLGQTLKIPEIKVRYICSKNVRKAWTSKSGPYTHFCWDGVYYDSKTVPADIRAYFEDSRAKHASTMANRRAPARAGRTVPAPAAATGVPVVLRDEPPAKTINAALLNDISVGMEAAAVRKALGEPHYKVSNLDDDGTGESWSYDLADGGKTTVRLRKGKVDSVRK